MQKNGGLRRTSGPTSKSGDFFGDIQGAAGWEGFLQGDFFLKVICRLKHLGNDLSSDSTTLHTRSTSAFSVNKMCKNGGFVLVSAIEVLVPQADS